MHSLIGIIKVKIKEIIVVSSAANIKILCVRGFHQALAANLLFTNVVRIMILMVVLIMGVVAVVVLVMVALVLVVVVVMVVVVIVLVI